MTNLLTLRTYVVFIITGIFVGMLITAQFKSSIPTSSYPSDQLAVQQELIKSFSDDEALLKSKIVTLRNSIDENQQRISTNSQDNNLEALSGLKRELGIEQAKGPGVSITINDGVFANSNKTDTLDQSLVHASDLRDIVNVLRVSKATAIAINDQRIIATTPISSVGNTLMVNNYHLLPPFNIVAIGDQEAILQRLNDPKQLPDLSKRVQDGKIQFSAQAMPTIIAPVYNGDLSYKFISAQPTAQ